MRKKSFIPYRLLPILFLLFLVFPFINKYTNIVHPVKNNENRQLAAKPTFDINNLDSYPEAYESYFNDHFSLRNNYNLYFNYWKYEYFDINPFPKKVAIGENDWLFFNARMMPSRRKTMLLKEDELISIKKELERRVAFLKEHNCSLYIAVIPAKPNVYTNKLKPPYYLPAHDTIETIGDQFITYMNSHSNLNIIDLKPSLLKQKEQNQIYHKLDHHCNQLGGFYMAETTLKQIHQDIPSVAVGNDTSDYQITIKRQNGGNLAKLLGLQDFLYEDRPYMYLKDNSKKIIQIKQKSYTAPENFSYKSEFEQRCSTQNDSLPNCMIIRDSFANLYREHISYGFNNSLFIWDNWEYKLNEEIFLKEQPDVMIIMILESQLGKLKSTE